MVQRVTDRAAGGGLSRKVRSQIDAILATITGPQLSFVREIGRDLALTLTWSLANSGGSPGNAGLRMNLQVDGFFGDTSQFILEADGVTVSGALAGVAFVQTTFPVLIQPGTSRSLTMDILIPTDALFDRQGSVQGFNWWIGELTARDLDKDELAQGDSRFEIRDWFRIEPSVTVPSVLTVVGNPGFTTVRV